MRYIDPDALFRCLVSEVRSGADFSTSPLIASILARAATSGLVGLQYAALVHVPLGFEFLWETADVLVTCHSPQFFHNVRAAYNDEKLRLEVRTQTASAPSSKADALSHRGNDELEIYGFVDCYCVFCIRRHARLNCLVFQFC